MRWKNDHVRTTRLGTREATVQECNGVKSVSVDRLRAEARKHCSHELAPEFSSTRQNHCNVFFGSPMTETIV